MKKYDQIHESILKDVIDIYNDISDLSNEEIGNLIAKHRGTRKISSIARASNDLICVFPVLASRNIAIENQAMISKAIEKNCVAMLQMLFSALQLSDARDAFEYIAQLHTNINKSSKLMDLDDVIQVADTIGITDAAIQIGAKVDNSIVEQVKKDMRNLNFYFEDTISDKSIAEGFTCNLDPNGQYIVQVETRTLLREDDENGIDDDSILDWNTRNHYDDAIEKLGGINNALKKELNRDEKIIKHLERERTTYTRGMEKLLSQEKDRNAKLYADYEKQHAENNDLKAGKSRIEAKKYIANTTKDTVDTLSKQVLNTEYKKANELMPTMMVINFKSKTDNGYETVDSAVIGVKAKLYPMSSEDMITHLVAKSKDANWVQKFIKASTREISFFKDFLFAIDKAKIDALSLSRKGSSNKMWKVLERRAAKSKWNRLMAKSNDSTAITTIMISQNEVDFIKKEYQIDISDVYNTRILMEAYNLLGICIVDESLEIAKFMWDTGEDLWETVAFSNLERESNDNTYKKVVNLMTKVM